MPALLLLLLGLQDDKVRVEGPPFVVFGDAAEYRLITPLKDVTPVWRVADAPAGIPSSVETVPAYDKKSFSVRDVSRLGLRSIGLTEGDVLLTVALESQGRRVATAEYKIRVGRPIRVKAWCRAVENANGGTRRGELFTDPGRRAGLQDEVNRFLRPCGVEVTLEAGPAVKAPDGWFDRDGRFRPVALKDGRNARSRTLQELLKHDEPGGLNVYLVGDCHWTTVREGFQKVVIEHPLVGVGLKDGQVVIDDSADPASLAHELGHAFGLEDLKEKRDRGRLMYTIRKHRTGVAFTYQEMKDARDRARVHLAAYAAPR